MECGSPLPVLGIFEEIVRRVGLISTQQVEEPLLRGASALGRDGGRAWVRHKLYCPRDRMGAQPSKFSGSNVLPVCLVGGPQKSIAVQFRPTAAAFPVDFRCLCFEPAT